MKQIYFKSTAYMYMFALLEKPGYEEETKKLKELLGE